MEQVMSVIILAFIVLGLMVVLACGSLIFLKVLPQLAEVLRVFTRLAEYASLNQAYLFTIFKVLGIAYISEFAAQICRDGGQNALAMKIEMAAIFGVRAVSIPMLMSVLESIMQILH